jgi:exodeoxyribonuclease VII small subunit
MADLPPHKWGDGREAAGGAAQQTDKASIDDLLDRLDGVIARLAEAKEPIEDLVVAYEEGVRLLQEAQARLERLGREAGVPA